MAEDEKDEAELELERLVFGDSKGFMESVQTFGKGQSGDTVMEDESADEDMEDGDGMAGMRDQDLFFMDTTGSVAPSAGLTHDIDLDAESSDDDADNALTRRKAAWQDSDDERISVSLAAVPKLRKLRVTADEDIVNGKEYIRRLRKQFLLLNPTPDWATEARQQRPAKRRRLSRDADDSGSEISSGEEDEDEQLATKPLSDLLRNASGLVRSSTSTRTRKLRPETLDVQRVRDVGITQPSSVDSISFHPTLPLLLTSGPSGTLYLHHIIPSPPAPEPNPLLTSLHLRSTPLSTTAFHPLDGRIFLSGRRRYFHVWDLSSGRVEKVSRIYGHAHEQRSMEVLKPSPCGRWIALKGSSRKGGGVINILSAQTLQWHTQLRIDSGQGVADFAWWRGGEGLTVAGKNGEVTEWSLEAESVVGRWSDAGAVGTTVLSLGGTMGRTSAIGGDRWMAIGSSSGIVNVYDRSGWCKGGETCPTNPEPTRVLDHLTTPVSTVAFAPDGQILAIASRWKKDALRLVHLPSCTVYKNWPTKATPLGRVTGVAFGKEDGGVGRMVVGNEAGKVRMWEIRA
ncbi:WD40 repeat-like protein [Myriangium duriaei CBS 260.36]|uniref:WD40 repeat-like protein n=1 Tax=Myriangium duriaei CBS 260.36 TaxID=1168546 RepID=A0A9P4J8H7_9PEZI|nr:WD40 repeat-like protein [Myriangium duriaei CBS 260.36]